MARCARQPISRYGRPIRRASSSACSRWRRAPRQSRRPQLGDAEVHERGGAQVVAARDVAGAVAPARLDERMASTRGADVATATGQREPRAPPAAGRTSRRRSAGTRAGQPLGDGQAGGALVEQPSKAAPWRRPARAPRRLGGAGRKRGEQRAQRRHAAVEDQADVSSASRRAACGQSPRGLGVADRLDRVAALLVPPRRRRGAASRRASGQSGAARAGADRRRGGGSGTSCARRRARRRTRSRPRALQDPLGARAAGEDVGQRAAHPLEHRGAQQQIADLLGLALQHLGEQVAGDRPLAAGELGDEALGIRVPGRARSRRAAGRPPSPRSARAAAPRLRRTSVTPLALQQLARLLEREAQVGARISVSRAVEAQPVQPERRVLRVASTTRSCGGSAPGSARADAAPPRSRSSCRSSMTSTTRLLQRRADRPAAARRRPRRETPASAPTRSTSPSSPTAPASASTTDSQKRCASRSPRSTETQATRGLGGLRPRSAAAPSSRCRPERRGAARLPARAPEAHPEAHCAQPPAARRVSDRRWQCARGPHPSCVSQAAGPSANPTGRRLPRGRLRVIPALADRPGRRSDRRLSREPDRPV